MGREGSGSCIPGEAWLGMYTRGLQPDVKCFKIYQCLVVEGRGEKLREELWILNFYLKMSKFAGILPRKCISYKRKNERRV